MELKNRDLYLKKLIAFKDTEPVKVITGIRRCGKSSVLKLMAKYLTESGISESQIVVMNFESHDYKDMTSDEVYAFVKSKAQKAKKLYVFLDEIQRVEKWEDAVNALRVDIDSDIYITGSNAYLLSSEYSTYLSGRYVEIKMLPLSFWEFLYFHGYEVERISAFGASKTIITKDCRQFELKDAFDAFLKFGGMPGICEVGLDLDKAMTFLDGIYLTVVVRDILERDKRKGQRQITDSELLKKIVYFLADNVGSSVSANKIGNVLASEGLLDKRAQTPSTHTVQSYVTALLESYFFYEIKRFDIKGKEYLRTLGKYYIVDNGLRNYLLGFRDRDVGHVLENVVYFELLRRGYDVAVGKIGNAEIDFIATNATEKVYIQVTESMSDESTRKRELAPLVMINDNYPKMILSLDTGFAHTFDGILSVNLIDWLLENK